MRVETYKNGNGLESFMEYLTCKYYNSHGYITENQIPSHFCKDKRFVELLKEMKLYDYWKDSI